MALSVRGGLRQGIAYLGMATVNAGLSTEKAGLWKNGIISAPAALFDGRPLPFEDNPYNTRWKLDRGDGILALLEYCHASTTGGLNGEYRLGIFSHNHIIERIFNPDLPKMPGHSTHVEYAIANRQVWVSDGREARLFLQPDLQYIVNPSGRECITPDCLACFLRPGVTL
jgi:hypothetical protein